MKQKYSCRAQHDALVACPADDSAAVEKAAAAFEESFQSLRKWVDTEASDYVSLHAQRKERNGQLASAVKVTFLPSQCFCFQKYIIINTFFGCFDPEKIIFR